MIEFISYLLTKLKERLILSKGFTQKTEIRNTTRSTALNFHSTSLKKKEETFLKSRQKFSRKQSKWINLSEERLIFSEG